MSADRVTPPQAGFRAPSAAAIVGISYRQLDYWTRTGLVSPTLKGPSGPGAGRLYSSGDLVRMRIIKRLLDLGVRLHKIRDAIAALGTADRFPSDAILACDGDACSVLVDEADVLDLIEKGGGTFLISLESVAQQLQHEIAASPQASSEQQSSDHCAATGTRG